jgi:hypothetical protein
METGNFRQTVAVIKKAATVAKITQTAAAKRR